MCVFVCLQQADWYELAAAGQAPCGFSFSLPQSWYVQSVTNPAALQHMPWDVRLFTAQPAERRGTAQFGTAGAVGGGTASDTVQLLLRRKLVYGPHLASVNGRLAGIALAGSREALPEDIF